MAEILYGVQKVVLTELDPLTQLPRAGGIVCNVDTAQTAEMDPVLSSGAEVVLREDTQVLAIAKTPDLVYGYDFKFTDNCFNIAVASLIEGGTVLYDTATPPNVIGYNSPMLSAGITMKPFKADIYVANYRGNSIINYVKITLNNCTGQAPKMAFSKDFYSPEFDIDAREATLAGLPMKQLAFVTVVPGDDTTVPILTMTSAVSLVRPAPIVGSSNELGFLYAIDSNAVVTTVTELNDLVNAHEGIMAPIITAGVPVSMITTSLNASKYKLYAIDMAGNISLGSAVITTT
jgi:hypothetical protein